MRHVLADSLAQRAHAAGRQNAHDIAFREDAKHAMLLVDDDNGADPVPLQDADGFGDPRAGQHAHDMPALVP